MIDTGILNLFQTNLIESSIGCGKFTKNYQFLLIINKKNSFLNLNKIFIAQ